MAVKRRPAARVQQQHQRQQPGGLGLVGHQLGQGAAQVQRLRGQLAVAVVAAVEDQVDHGQHRGQAVGQLVLGRHPERDARRPDLALGPHQPLGHRGLGHQERPGDLGCGQAAEAAQGKRHLGVHGQRRMAAGEQQLQPLVGDRPVLAHLVLHRLGPVQQPGLRGQRPLAPDPVDGVVAGRRHQPRARIVRRPVCRPAGRGGGEGLLGGLLGKVEVAEEAGQRRQHPAPLLPEDLLVQRSTTGRTSTAPPRLAAGTLAATSMAASRSSASTRK